MAPFEPRTSTRGTRHQRKGAALPCRLFRSPLTIMREASLPLWAAPSLSSAFRAMRSCLINPAYLRMGPPEGPTPLSALNKAQTARSLSLRAILTLDLTVINKYVQNMKDKLSLVLPLSP